MVELFEQDIRTNDRQSSKGNQLKWKNNHIWYKADYAGYEGLADSPIFDHGAALLSDTKMDYPLTGDVYHFMEEVGAKTICRDFDEQLDVSEELYGENLKFYFTKKDVDDILSQMTGYHEQIIERVRTILYMQMRKYEYLF